MSMQEQGAQDTAAAKPQSTPEERFEAAKAEYKAAALALYPGLLEFGEREESPDRIVRVVGHCW